jgi:hypothetical protein
MKHRWNNTAMFSEGKQSQCYSFQHSSYKLSPRRRDTPDSALARPIKNRRWNFHLKRIRIIARGSGKFIITNLENLPYQVYSSVTKKIQTTYVQLYIVAFSLNNCLNGKAIILYFFVLVQVDVAVNNKKSV